MTLGSLFDGIAGFPYAASKVGIKTVWASEIEEKCVEIAAVHFPDAKQLGDIKQINGAEIEAVDIISFGSPCQNLSVAGDHEGLEGEKSQLFFEAIRIIDEMRCATNGEYPKYIIWENVDGALSSNKGNDFRRVLEEITKTQIPIPRSGRWAAAGLVRNKNGRGDTAWRKINAEYFGTPQRRNRIYLVRSFGRTSAGQILFECESMLGYAATCGREEKADTNRTKNCAYGTDCGGMAQGARKQSVDFGRSGDGIYINPDKSVTLKGTDGGGGAATGLYMLPVYTVIGNVISRKVKSGGNQPGISDDGVAPTLTARDRHAVVYAQYQTEDSKAYGPSGFAEYREGVGALRASRGGAGGGKENLIVSKRKVQGIIKHVVRRLTPTECELLQGYPVGWTLLDTKGKQISDNARYKALGNSLAVPCAERVFIGIVAAEQEERA